MIDSARRCHLCGESVLAGVRRVERDGMLLCPGCAAQPIAAADQQQRIDDVLSGAARRVREQQAAEAALAAAWDDYIGGGGGFGRADRAFRAGFLAGLREGRNGL